MREWERCCPWIEAALAKDPGGRSIDEVRAYVAAGEAQLWPGERCAAVTEWFEFPRFRGLNVWLMGGDIKELLGPVLERITTYARLHGATRLYGGAYDRPGWRKALGRVGFEPQWTVFTKELAQ